MIPAVVAGPPLAPPRHGLVTSARDATGADPEARWEGGIAWTPASCASAGVIGGCDVTTEKTLTADDQDCTENFTPFVVWAGGRMSTFAGDADERERRARELLAAKQHLAIEDEFLKGTAAQANGWDNNYLLNLDTLTPLSSASIDSAAPLVYGLAALEEAIADTSQRGMIHATVQTAVLWYAAGAIRREGGLLLTALDNIVVPGSGYDGTAPTGYSNETTEHPWAYATGLVDVRLGPVTVFGDERSIDRRTNTWEVRAERSVTATFDPCLHVGIRVDLCETFCDPVGS